MKKVYEQGLYDCHNGTRNWVYNVRKLLNDYGFSYIFDNCYNTNLNGFHLLFKQRVIDTYIQEWNNKIQVSTILRNYMYFKPEFGYESYLNQISNSLRFFITRLRLSEHPLRTQTGRYNRNRIERNERYCLTCNSLDLEDEYHFICICNCYKQLRKKYIDKRYYINPSNFKFLELLKSTDKYTLINLAKFIKCALDVRKTILNANV